MEFNRSDIIKYLFELRQKIKAFKILKYKQDGITPEEKLLLAEIEGIVFKAIKASKPYKETLKDRKKREAQEKIVFAKNPSQKTKYINWIGKDINKWTINDFIGFYSYQYKNEFGFEDVSIINECKRRAEKKCSRYFIKYFIKDKYRFKHYIEWFFKESKIIKPLVKELNFIDGLLKPKVYDLYEQKVLKS